MGIEKVYSVLDSAGVPAQLPPGTYHCHHCLKRLKTIPATLEHGTLSPCPKCGSTKVFKM